MTLSKEEMIQRYHDTGMTYSSYNAGEGSAWRSESDARAKARQDFYDARDALKAANIERPKFEFLISSNEL